jgi:amidase
MTPTFSTEIVKVGVFRPDLGWREQREHLLDYAGYCWIDNFAGTPAISLPLGFSKNGLPVGIQFTTRPGGEAVLLALAYQLEAELEWWRHKPPYWVGDE